MLFLILGVMAVCTPPLQDTFNVKDVSEYRLTVPVFTRFDHASRLIVTATRTDSRLAGDPLFTRDVSVLDDVVAAATLLEGRLSREPAFQSALFAADISPREYTKFALALFAARLAHGFMKSGALRRIPAGVATDNVAFIDAHHDRVVDLLRALGVE